jgi:sec-independent protein translocase protein TatA
MGSLSIWHWLIVLVVVLIVFGGRGKVSQIMGDFGKGLRAFKKSMREDEPFEDQAAPPPPPPQLSTEPLRPAEPAAAGPTRPQAAAPAASSGTDGDKVARG